MTDLKRREIEIVFFYATSSIRGYARNVNVRDIFSTLLQSMGFKYNDIQELLNIYTFVCHPKRKPSKREVVYVLSQAGYRSIDIARILKCTLNYVSMLRGKESKIHLVYESDESRKYDLMISYLIMAGKFEQMFFVGECFAKVN